jgi:hypothetical protein
MSLPITSLRNGWPTNHRIKYDRTCGAPHKKHGISTPILHHLVMLGGIVASVCLAQPFACSTPALALTHVMLGHFVCLRGGEYHPSEHRTLAPCCHGCCSSGCGWHPSRGHLLCAALLTGNTEHPFSSGWSFRAAYSGVFWAPITRAASSSPRPRSRRLRLPRSRAGALDYGARIARALLEN